MSNSTTHNSRISKLHSGEIVAGDVTVSNNNSSGRGLVRSYYFDSPLSRIDPIILTSSIPDVFEQFVRSLPADLKLSRGGFVIAHQGDSAVEPALSLIAISDIDTVCAGLGIAIPSDNSALHEISDSNCLKTVTPAKDLRGNFVERHALIVSAGGCMGMYPLEIDQFTIGVVTLNFSDPSACSSASKEISLAKTKLAERIAKVTPRIASIPTVAFEI